MTSFEKSMVVTRLTNLIKTAKKKEKLDAVFNDVDNLIDMPKEEEYVANYLLRRNVLLLPFAFEPKKLLWFWSMKILLGFDDDGNPCFEYYFSKNKEDVIQQAKNRLSLYEKESKVML